MWCRAAQNDIGALPAGKPVVAQPTLDVILAISATDLAVRIGEDLVVAGAGIDDVALQAAQDGVVTVATVYRDARIERGVIGGGEKEP